MKRTILAFLCLTLAACSTQGTPSDATQGEISMAEMMGITVEELRKQTPQEHMQMMQHMMNGQQTNTSRAASNTSGFLPGLGTDIDSLPEAKATETIQVKDGDTIELNPTLVRKTINGKQFAMYGYNGQIPGPLIKAPKGATISVRVQNKIDMETTIHWHGLRLDNGSDGIPDVTQDAILPNGSFTYTVTMPDDGIYWYHPHVREDIQQDMGLYGNLLVEPTTGIYQPVNAEQVLVVDDLLLGQDGKPVAYGKKNVNFSLMGRFGNVMLTNGKTDYSMEFAKGSVVRFFITNVANTRTFRLQIPNANIKLIGSDVGRYEKEEWADAVILAPAERAIIEVQFAQSGQYELRHIAGGRNIALATIRVTDTPAQPSYAASFGTLQENADVIADIDTVRSYFDKPVDKKLRLTIDMHGGMGMMNHGGMMHSDDGIEWEDTMPQMNAMMSNEAMDWALVDEATGDKNMDIHWMFKKGDLVKVRINNDERSAHPMQHPIHFHGQRFLVLSMDGKKTDNLVWKDTVLVPSGSTAEILIEMSNVGDWMFHCHIAEHLSNGMMGMFTVQ